MAGGAGSTACGVRSEALCSSHPWVSPPFLGACAKIRSRRIFLGCRILAHGFARARCDACGHDFLIAFSCKGRAVCPSCNTRRMAETAAHLADHVLPRVPVRQGRYCPYRSGYAITSSMTAKPSTVPCAFFWMRSSTTCAAAWGVPVPRHAPGPCPSSTVSPPLGGRISAG